MSETYTERHWTSFVSDRLIQWQKDAMPPDRVSFGRLIAASNRARAHRRKAKLAQAQADVDRRAIFAGSQAARADEEDPRAFVAKLQHQFADAISYVLVYLLCIVDSIELHTNLNPKTLSSRNFES